MGQVLEIVRKAQFQKSNYHDHKFQIKKEVSATTVSNSKIRKTYVLDVVFDVEFNFEMGMLNYENTHTRGLEGVGGSARTQTTATPQKVICKFDYW